MDSQKEDKTMNAAFTAVRASSNENEEIMNVYQLLRRMQ
ncbi:uncharacterized protein RAG0_04940 [Rhynchosporium agropyri]|uniref:Uncharacterized protein n=3 Tax=Rhynchosporium TaxID=38037 RepID=A0A1E1M060_RHYSE|nr:uncharacterized protein RCO7_14248 [Rhynchosporium commune]CZS95188.1 uncharacterized protein RAG0_04940 [Rhynchosporium agropyri]CZT42492.1 uncharacterized protein RSE6_02407 [Rhynchosporium secalis]